ncbi:M42 family metallopeptidase [candidate division CSSED10-310 bacterium]|uniref:M42 family metallopeptidase n=1 Tax=candidate division CSSED10-310 bacterium TaxID=2855610 RepID=A0ABV6YTW9_UNCC1
MKNKLDLKFLESLCEIPSLSGHEQNIQKLIYGRMEKFADEMQTDVLGNVYAIKNPEASFKVMIVGHCDEVGFRVNYIDDSGFIFLSADYGADHRIAPGKRVTIQTVKGPVVGVIGRKSRALQQQEERLKALEITNIWVDIGCSSREEARRKVNIGDPVMYGSNLAYLENDLVSSRALDDKIGVFIAMETFRLLAAHDLKIGLYCVSSAQEEAGMRGAQTAAYRIKPQCGIVIDVSHASDIPGVDPRTMGKKKLGEGPVLIRGPNVNENLVRMLHQIARTENMPIQLISRSKLTGTDAKVIQVSRAGVATGLIYIPIRYMHLPSEVCSLKDVIFAVELLTKFLINLAAESDFDPLSGVIT